MDEILLGILAILIGAFLCFRGYWALRFIISLWGGFTGFAIGAAGVAALTNETVLASVLGWVVGLAVAILFAILAYLYYAVAVVVAMGSFGYVLGVGALSGLGLTWSWAIVLGAVALGVLLAIAAIAANLPMMLLIVIGALSGATAMVTGVMLVTGQVTIDALASTDAKEYAWYWGVASLVLAVAGVIVQSRAAGAASVRTTWQQGPAPLTA